MKVTAKQLGLLYNVDRRTVTNWINEQPPCPSRLSDEGKREFDTVEVAAWREDRAVRRALAERAKEKGGDKDGERESVRKQRERFETRLLELDVAEREGQLVTLATHEAVVGEVSDRLRSVCINLPTTFSLDLEREGVSPDAAEAFLDRLSLALVTAMRAAGEELEAASDEEDDSVPALAMVEQGADAPQERRGHRAR